VRAEGPGITSIRVDILLFARIRDIRREPGSEMPGVPASVTKGYKAGAGVRDAGRAGVGDECDMLSFDKQTLYPSCGDIFFIFIATHQWFFYAVAREEFAGYARILARDDIRAFEGLKSAERDIPEIPDGGPND